MACLPRGLLQQELESTKDFFAGEVAMPVTLNGQDSKELAGTCLRYKLAIVHLVLERHDWVERVMDGHQRPLQFTTGLIEPARIILRSPFGIDPLNTGVQCCVIQ